MATSFSVNFKQNVGPHVIYKKQIIVIIIKDETGTWGLKSNKSHLDPWSKLAELLILHPNYSICSLKYFNPD